MAWNIRKPVEQSGWTIETVLEYVNARISDMELRNQQRFEAQIEASNQRNNDMELRQQQRFEAQTRAIEAAITAQRAAIDAALVSADRATLKAEAANDIRFKSVNEFRSQLNDQAATFITRIEVDGMAQRNTDLLQSMTSRMNTYITREEALAAIGRNSERAQDLGKRMDSFVSRDAVLAQYNQVMTRVDALTEQQTLAKGRGVGINAIWVYVLGAIAAIGTIVSLYVAMK